MQTKKIYIKGMHCVSCEKLLNSEFKNISGVKDVRVDRQKNIAEMDYENNEPDFTEIKKIAKKFGYDAFEKEPDVIRIVEKASWAEWVNAVLIVLAIIFIYRVFQNLGILDAINIKSNDISFGISFLIGIVASLSSCLAVVGAVIIAFGEKYQSEGNDFYEGAVKPNLLFHAGRLGTFFVLGGLLGLIGGEISISGNFISIFTILIAIVMAWLGLNILGVLPPISNMGIRMPKSLTKHWDKLKQSEHKAAPLLLGGLSFFLPCGFTQSMQIFALASGSFLTGGLSLFLFALGTVPTLMVLGITASWTRTKKMVVLQKTAGFLVLIFALYTLNSGLALKGVKTAVVGGNTKQEAVNANADAVSQDKQTVEMRVTYQGFQPSVLTVKKGVPVRWIIKGDQVTSCTNKIIVPSLNISKNIVSGDNVIEFTPTQAGEIPFSCWMGMVRGKFIVQ